MLASQKSREFLEKPQSVKTVFCLTGRWALGGNTAALSKRFSGGNTDKLQFITSKN